VLAVDLGATSVRVAAVDLDREEPKVEVLHRWRHGPVADPSGSLRWDWDGIVAEVEKGLRIGVETGKVASIGVDGWGVDYGFLTRDGALVDQPYSYRDDRTDDWEKTLRLVGRDRLYQVTGVQLMAINTIFQLAADKRERLTSAGVFLLLPDLLVNHLTGWVGCELSNLSTTGLMDARERDWSFGLIDELGLPRDVFPAPEIAGSHAGDWEGIPVHLVGSHDTASAFLGAPVTGQGSVVVSTGSWVIVGVERDAPDTSPAAEAANFSNEAGALGGTRFLKNVVGFWILEQCRTAWGSPPIEELLAEANRIDVSVPTFDPRDDRFVSPDDMLGEVIDASGLPSDVSQGVIAKCIIESIVEGVIEVVREIEATAGISADNLAVIGGGARIPMLASLLEEKSGINVTVGAPEAAALGNAIVQGIALGRFSDLAEARRWITQTEVAA
jgi:rhamnulokinase